MGTKISNAAAIASVNAVVDLLDVGGAGSVEIRTGSQPTDVDSAATGTLLGTLTLNATAFGNAVDATGKATATANAITGDSSADATGTAGWFRAKSGAGTAVIDGNITATTGGGDMELNNISITSGGSIDITSWTFTQPES